MRPDILIQNVSAQCIPNLVAARTFRPRRIVWIHTPEFAGLLDRLRRLTRADSPGQEQWQVDARDAEALHRVLSERFSALPADARVVYHLTGGTKSMALQGLYNLGSFRRERGAEVCGVVMDPRTQHFDIVYPQPVNNAVACAVLTLEQMLAVHGSSWDGRHRHAGLAECAEHGRLWEGVRSLAKSLKQDYSLNQLRALHRRPASGPRRHFRSLQAVPDSFRRIMDLLQGHGFITSLRWPAANEFRYHQTGIDVIKLVNGGWLEHWLGTVLHGSGIGWQGARVSAKVLEGDGGSQEFDFLGANSRNRLVYWSCKTDARLVNDRLFEVDALRDGIAGADFHVAGLLHTAPMPAVMQAKARRMNLHAVHAFADNAAEQLVRISGG